MLSLTETMNYEKIIGFSDHPGIAKRVSPSGIVDKDLIKKTVSDRRNIFLIAKDDDKEVGFICFYPVTQGAMQIHVVLRTVGDKTKKLIGIAMNYARYSHDCKVIHAIYPKSARAVNRLCRYFNFKNNPSLKSILGRNEQMKDFAFESVPLN